ncbi:hypothetical protein ERJ75_001198900 [Trypanosoma vivax]|nr:hypothetical protein ERJ75_001198900 [Trypanosoma vivax]
MDEGCASESAKKEATGAVPTDENETRECSPKVPMEVSRKDLFSFEARGGTPVKNECETVSVLGGADLGQRCASQQGEDRGHSPFILGLDEEPAAPPARVRVVGTFDEMIKKLEEMEAISGYLRQQIAIQNRIIKKLEQENTCLKDKVTSLEDSLFRSEGMRLFYCNQMQEKEQDLRHAQQMNLQLKSRLRSQEHRPWQRTVLRVLGDLCGASTAQSELEDESRIEGNKRPNVQAGNFKDSGFESGSGSPGRTPQASPLQVRRVASAGSSSGRSSVADANAGANNDSKNRLLNTTPMSEEERLFGQMAPIVLSSTRYMPDSQTILRDWANNCLDDLESLDGLRGGALTTRFHNFSQEVRSGVLLSRLLFYLALPRYQNKAVNKAQSLEGTRATMIVNFTEHRRRLLMQQNVQLDSPFPTYSDCFGDLLNMQPVSRMSLLMQFATELIEGYDHVGDKMAQMRLTQLYDNTISTLGLTVPTPVDKVDMQEIIDPNSLALGDRSAVITFIALLYVRFSHPFNHKAKESALIEKEAMLQLLSGGAHKRSQDGIVGLVTPSDASISPREGNEEEGRGDMFHAQKFIAELEEEEHSPWQLFLRHCQPLIGTMAHPYILRGNFWPSLSFDSPELVRILGSLGTALQRSLQKHRWHIIMSCLVPVRTYSALSRGVFTGSRASPAALQAGLERDGDWVFLSDLSCLKDVFETREKAIREAIGSGELKNNGGWDEEEWDTDGYFISEDRQGLMKAFETCGTDLLQLFLHHARLSNSCAMPALDLGNWRMLLIDVGLIMPDNPEEASLDLEQATVLFCRVMSSIGEVRGVSGSPEGTEKEPSRPPLPHFSGEMFYSEFVAALLLLLHELYPPVSTISTGERAGTKRVGWLGEALSDFTFKFVTPKTISFTGDQGSAIAKRICSNAKTHEVLVRHNKVLLAVFGHYSREVCGVSGIEKEQLLLMLRDAMITSTEISQSLILDLFKVCSVSKRTDEMHAEDRRRDNDARPRDSSAGRRRGNVSIVDPSGEKSALTSKTKEHEILLYEGFLEFICVICHFKQPNPLIPFEARLDVFLRRGLLRPLAHRNEGLASLMAYDKQRGQSDW